jgi:hypothetical protein
MVECVYEKGLLWLYEMGRCDGVWLERSRGWGESYVLTC